MKQLLIYCLFILGLSMAACNDTPTFPDPGLDSTRSAFDTVRRDTIDTYYLEMNVKAPNGIYSIQILDGLTYKEIDRLDEYNGKTNFLLRYPIDLSDITDEDKTLKYIVKVIDNDMRSYNKAFSLTVKRFSTPTITFSGANGILGLISPVFELKAFFETGLNTIESYKVTFEGETIDEGTVEGAVSEYNYSHICNLPMEKEQTYRIAISLTDNKGTTNEETMELRLIEMERPLQVFIFNYNTAGTRKLNRSLEFVYNSQHPDQLERLDGIIYSTVLIEGVSQEKQKPFSYNFSYTDFGFVERMEEYEGNITNSEMVLGDAWTYIYDDTQRLTDIKNDEESPYDFKMGEWYEDNRVKGYAYFPDYPILEQTCWQTSATGDNVMADVWLISKKRALGTRMSAITIPSYLPSLPPFIPKNPGTSYEDMQVLLMWQYGFETIHEYDDSKKGDFESYASVDPKIEYSYVTNVNGRLEKIIKRTVYKGERSLSREYLFIYE